MKTLILIAALAILSQLTANSQGCLPEGISFTYQYQIDNFQTNFPGCTEILGDVYIDDNGIVNNITNLQGLNTVTSIGGSLIISNNKYLNGFGGLESLTTIGGTLKIFSNDTLTSLEGLGNISSIGGIFRIEGNAYLTTLADFENLITVGAGLQINYNDSLQSLSGFENLTTVSGDFSIGYNSVLINLMGLQNLSFITGAFSITYNQSLINLTGLENLNSIEGSMIIQHNDALTTLTGLDNLTSLGEDFAIEFNDVLTSLTGLENLTSIGGTIAIVHNDTLPGLNGLENIQANTIEYLAIHNNSSLSECDVQSICEYLAAPGGEMDFHNNAPGCNSPEEVQQACLTSVKENVLQEEITLSPNPASSFITITVPGDMPIEEAIIYNHLGQKVFTAKPVNNMVDISGLKQGIYILEVVTKNRTIREVLLVE
jgi:hypothetical protein